MAREIEYEDDDACEQASGKMLLNLVIVCVLVRVVVLDISIFQTIDIRADRTRITRRQR